MMVEIRHFNKQIKQSYYRIKNISKGYNFLCAIDDTPESLKMLKLVRGLASKKEDKIYIVHVIDSKEFNKGTIRYRIINI